MREIIFDTETTGFRPEEGERIIEIGAIEMVNRIATGITFHEYLSPEGKQVNPGAFQVHGLSNEFLTDKKTFAQIVDEFLGFIDGANLVAHNAAFDMNFLNHELARLKKPAIDDELVIDTLQMARKKFPMAQNSLNRLCERFHIDNSKRTKHGALLDCELLAEVYIELLGGRQTSLELESHNINIAGSQVTDKMAASIKPQRKSALPTRLTQDEIDAHNIFINELGENAIWKQLS